MAHHKLILEDDFKEDFSLIAIHCSEEAYKMAYLLNKFVSLHLQRREVDLDYSNNGLQITFALYEFENAMLYTTYNLVGNKCKSLVANVQSSSGLFGDSASETVTTYLLPEYKKVDFFLKISSDFEVIPLRKLVANINEIKQVISAYVIVTDDVKSKSNLIFD